MRATLEHVGHDVVCQAPGASPEDIRIDGEDFLPRLSDWAARYDQAVRTHDADVLATLGREMFVGLDSAGWATAWTDGAGPRCLEVRVAGAQDPLARALLDAPWELLASTFGFLADDETQLFEVTRRIGRPSAPLAPKHADLQLMFMAAAPEGADELDFEAEEGAILRATAGLPLHLVVEESGATQPLADRLALDGPFEAVHLSCHGEIHPKHEPFLAFENELGARQQVYPGEMAKLLGDPDRTPLVFLSACRTAEQTEGGAADRPGEPFVRNLVRAGVHNVVGWDGSVFDADAAAFAKLFYRELARYERIPRAVALARQNLRSLNRGDPQQGRHWHLARLYLGVSGGGSLSGRGLPKRKLASTSHANQFLDEQRNEVQVASREAFVGRRRPLQAVLRAFAAGSEGVLVHGMGNLGKSSLAHRIATRMTGFRTVVVFKHYDASAVLDRLLEAAPASERQNLRSAWRPAVAADAAALADALERLLENEFDSQPILLVIDDLESILETPSQSLTAATTVQARFRSTLAAVLGAFARVRTTSRLLITSRYRFSLSNAQGQDMALALTNVPLRPMARGERIKQLRAIASVDQLERADKGLLQRLLTVADGNPGLQATLMTPVLAGETEAASHALAAIEEFQRTGVPPESLAALQAQGVAQDQGNALLAFFRRMAFNMYRNALTDEQARLLAVACVFEPGLPIPRTAIEAGGGILDLPLSVISLDRLLALGLLDDWGAQRDIQAVSANPLARPLVATLTEEDSARVADASVHCLADVWRDNEGGILLDSRAVELARITLMAPTAGAETVDQTAAAAAHVLFNIQHEARRALDEVLKPALSRLSTLSVKASPALARIAFDCAELLGDRPTYDTALDSLAASIGDDDFGAGSTLLRLARAHSTAGETERAERCLKRAAEVFQSAGAEREFAIARGSLADILQDRGQLDEALRIRTEEQLPVYERLGDVREKAVTMGQIADILQARGQLDEALAMHAQRLPTARGMGDVDSVAHVLFSTARIQLQRGDHNRDGLQTINENLSEAFAISSKSGRINAVAAIGTLLAQVLAMGGETDRALEALGDAEAAYLKLGRQEGIEHVQELRRLIDQQRPTL